MIKDWPSNFNFSFNSSNVTARAVKLVVKNNNSIIPRTTFFKVGFIHVKRIIRRFNFKWNFNPATLRGAATQFSFVQ
jgi:hypothetical protein